MEVLDIKYFDGNNIKRRKRIIRTIFNGASIEEVERIAEQYINICTSFGIKEELIALDKLGEEVHLWISYSDEALAQFIWDCIINNKTIGDEAFEKGKAIYRNGFEKKLIEKAARFDIPVIRINNDLYQLGYGKNSVQINYNMNPEIDTLIENLEARNIGNIPIFSITGTNGKTTTTRLLYHALIKLGYFAGVACTGEIKIGGETVEKGDTTGYLSARRVLTDNRVEAVAFETARGGILRNGLGYESAKSAIITSLSEDHLGMDGINSLQDLIKIKSVILQEICSDGKWVLRAQEDIINEAKEIAESRRREGIDARSFEEMTSLISIDYCEPIQKHMKAGGEVYFLEKGYIIHGIEGKNNKLINIKEIPFTHGGISKGNVINVMSVLSALSTIEKDTAKLLQIIKGIPCDIEHNPGRQNILSFGDVNILIDYGHNPEAYEFVYSIVRGLNPTGVTSIITVAGDRSDSHIERLGYLAGRESKQIIIREQKDQRGSAKGRVASLMEKGVLKAGVAERDIKFIENAGEALIYALGEAVPGEVIVIFTEELEGVLESLKNYSDDKREEIKTISS
jgi:UDP-N-acetylmuramyl tripeptide synthase